MHKPFTNIRFRKPFKVPCLFIFSLPLLLFCCKDKGGTIAAPGEGVGAQHYADWPGLANSPWPMFMHDPQHTGRSPYKGPQMGAVQWRFDATSFVYSSPVIDEDGTIYVGSNDGYLYSINGDGSLKWKYKTAAPIFASPLISSDGTIYAVQGAAGLASGNGALYAFDRSGNTKWIYQFIGNPYAPTISKDGNTIFVTSAELGTNPARLYAIGRDGTLRWTFEKQGDDKLSTYNPAFSEDGTALYVPGVEKLFAVDTSGLEKWEFYTGSDISSPSIDNEGNIYVLANKLYSLSADGIVRWTSNAATTNEPPVPSIGWDGTIYVNSGGGGSPDGDYVHAYTQGGNLEWTQYVGGFSQGNPISDIDGTVYVGSIGRMMTPDSTNFYAINHDGTKKFAIILRSPDGSIPDIDSTPAIDLGGRLYVGCDSPRGYHVFAIH